MRPASRCKGYVPPRIASTSGDPHMVTLDGLHYTFNGVGEFILVTDQNDELNIQARMEQFKDDEGYTKQASVITSLAVQCNSSLDVVEIRLNEIRLVDVLVNGELVDFTDTESVSKEGTTIMSSRGNNVTDIIWTTVNCRFPNIALNVTAMKKMINFNLMVAGQELRGTLRGLLGNFNGRTDDDFISRAGVEIPINASLETIHQYFGLPWMTNASESLFTYAIGKNHQSFQRKDFRPTFNPMDHCSENNVTGVCGDDSACQFDLCTTNDASVAAVTKHASEEMNILSELTLPACGVLSNVPNGYWNYSGHSASLECNPGYSPNGTTTVQCGNDGNWSSITNVFCEESGCGVLDNVPFGTWNYSDDHSAFLQCYPGFRPNGPTTVQCTEGKWSPFNTVCEMKNNVVSCSTILQLSYRLPILLVVVHKLYSMLL